MRKRNIVLTETPEKISYTALISAICEKIKNEDEYINCNNIENLKSLIDSAERTL